MQRNNSFHAVVIAVIIYCDRNKFILKRFFLKKIRFHLEVFSCAHKTFSDRHSRLYRQWTSTPYNNKKSLIHDAPFNNTVITINKSSYRELFHNSEHLSESVKVIRETTRKKERNVRNNV